MQKVLFGEVEGERSNVEQEREKARRGRQTYSTETVSLAILSFTLACAVSGILIAHMCVRMRVRARARCRHRRRQTHNPDTRVVIPKSLFHGAAVGADKRDADRRPRWAVTRNGNNKIKSLLALRGETLVPRRDGIARLAPPSRLAIVNRRLPLAIDMRSFSVVDARRSSLSPQSIEFTVEPSGWQTVGRISRL